MTREKLEACIQPDRNLFDLAADGEHAVERWVDSAEGSLARADRAMVVDTDALDAADEHAKRLAPVVRCHPEV